MHSAAFRVLSAPLVPSRGLARRRRAWPEVRADKMQEVREAWLARHPLDRDALAALPPSFDAGNLARAYPDLARLGLEQEVRGGCF